MTNSPVPKRAVLVRLRQLLGQAISNLCQAKRAKAEATAMKYVYILESENAEHFYVGLTEDLRARLAKHNAGEVRHTSKYRPWRIKTFLAFSDAERAIAFEQYLKSGSGRAFARKRL